MFAAFRPIVVVTLLLTLAVSLSATADARFGKAEKKKTPDIENFEPPAEDAFQTQCDPIRQKVVNLNSNTPKYARILIVPQREVLMARHRRCKAKIMDQEFQYLKHVDVKNPTLPAMPKPQE